MLIIFSPTSAVAVIENYGKTILRFKIAEIKAYAEHNGYFGPDITYKSLAYARLQETINYMALGEQSQTTYKNIIEYETSGFEPLAIGQKCN